LSTHAVNGEKTSVARSLAALLTGSLRLQTWLHEMVNGKWTAFI